MDCETGELRKEAGFLRWLVKRENSDDSWGYEFQQFHIYKVKARKCKPVELNEYQSEAWNRRYYLTEVIGEATHPELNEIKEYYEKPLKIEVGDIFAGHSIQVDIDADGEFSDAYLVG